MKKIVFVFTLLFSFLGYSQIFNPVKWSSKIEQKSDNEFVLVMEAVIDDEWHLYSQFTPEGGSQPTVFNFKDSKGKTIKKKSVKKPANASKARVGKSNPNKAKGGKGR